MPSEAQVQFLIQMQTILVAVIKETRQQQEYRIQMQPILVAVIKETHRQQIH